MSKTITTTTAVAILAFAVTGTAQARGGHGIGGRHLLLGPPPVGVPQQPVTPQFNNLGPQMSVPYTGNAVDQLSPLMGAGQPDVLGIR